MNAKAILDRMKLTLTVQTDLELSERIRVPAGTINTWKKRDRVPFDLLDRFSDDYDVSLDWLVKGTAPQNTTLSVDQVAAKAFQIAVRMTFLLNGLAPDEAASKMRTVKNFQRLIEAQVAVQVASNGMTLETAFELQERTLERLSQTDVEKLADWPNLV